LLTRRDRAVLVPDLPEVAAHIGGNPPQPQLVVEVLSEGCRFAEIVECPSDFSEGPERIPQVKPQVDGLLLRGAARKMSGRLRLVRRTPTSRRAERRCLVTCRLYAAVPAHTSPRRHAAAGPPAH
jgi:hypothetical protein